MSQGETKDTPSEWFLTILMIFQNWSQVAVVCTRYLARPHIYKFIECALPVLTIMNYGYPCTWAQGVRLHIEEIIMESPECSNCEQWEMHLQIVIVPQGNSPFNPKSAQTAKAVSIIYKSIQCALPVLTIMNYGYPCTWAQGVRFIYIYCLCCAVHTTKINF